MAAAEVPEQGEEATVDDILFAVGQHLDQVDTTAQRIEIVRSGSRQVACKVFPGEMGDTWTGAILDV